MAQRADEKNEKKILCVGLVCLDIISVVDEFPREDSDNSAVLICAWAEKGADASDADGTLLHSDAFPPECVLDTLGAGDTFNAAVIHKLANGCDLQDALTFGCRVAGCKCGFHGYDAIAEKLSALTRV